MANDRHPPGVGWYAAETNRNRERYWDGAKWSDNDRWRRSSTPDFPAELRAPDLTALKYRDDCLYVEGTYLGGAGLSLLAGGQYALEFSQTELRFFGAAADVAELTSLSRLQQIDIDGPGMVVSGGGFIGGGLGLVGAAEGMAIASMLNRLTTKTRIVTIINLHGTDFEAFFVNNTLPPEQMRYLLSPVFVNLRSMQARPERDGSDVVEQLERLGRLFASGVIDEAEFKSAKAKLLA